jgi:hypothetical protein
MQSLQGFHRLFLSHVLSLLKFRPGDIFFSAAKLLWFLAADLDLYLLQLMRAQEQFFPGFIHAK